MEHAINYEDDFYSWLMYNAQLLKQGRFADADIDNIVEELEGMSRSEKRALINRLAVLLTHLLKWQFQPARRSKSWKYTVAEQRRKVCKLLKESPSFRHGFDAKTEEAYEDALYQTAKETHLDISVFPSVCPYSSEQILDMNFYPDSEQTLIRRSLTEVSYEPCNQL